MDKYKFGNKLTEYRTEKGLTQSELGEILGVSNKAVSKWENGSAMPRLDMMSKITDFFGVSMDEFLDIPSGKAGTNEELEQKYLKLYNEKMKRRHIIRVLLFFVLPVLLLTAVFIYIFGPVLLVRITYDNMSEYAKMKPEKYEDYDLTFDYTNSFGKVGNVAFSLPDGTELFSELSNVEKSYKKISENGEMLAEDGPFDIYHMLYSGNDGGLEHIDYLLNFEEEWFTDNFDGKHYRMYDLKWLEYNYDWKHNIKLCDWKKAKMSYRILSLWSVAAPVSDRVIEYNGENAKGFITVLSDNGVTTYIADLYNENGESIGIVYNDANKNDSSDYKTFCMMLNSVTFTGEEVLDEETERMQSEYETAEREREEMNRRKEELPYVTPNPDLEILTADEMKVYSLNEDMTEEDIVSLLGQPKEIKEEVLENIWGKKVYAYDGVNITFLTTLYGEPLYDKIYSAVFTENITEFPRGIKIGDSMESVISKFPQERDKDYRITGEIYGDGNYKFTKGFANVKDYYVNGECQVGEYEMYISCGYWPTLYLRFDKDLNVSLIAIVYRSNGISTGFIE
ncbi:MAG: helix-turn-helix domain-containing protein [Clostridiales bacterium]|nr:helix-turn-helix domain-containing protein [Clostridiales bacterium]